LSNIDIRNHDKILTFKTLWLKEQYQKLRMDPELSDYTNDELKEYLLKIYDGRKIYNGRLYNNATNDNQVMTQEQFINKYLNEPVILSGYSCLYQNQDNSINISAKALENLGDMRKFYKKKMEAAEHRKS